MTTTMTLTDEQAKKLSPESEKSFRQCFIEDMVTGRIRFTQKGRAEYGPRFAKAGIDIKQIRNRDQLRDASIRSEWVVWEEIRGMVQGHEGLEEILKPLWS